MFGAIDLEYGLRILTMPRPDSSKFGSAVDASGLSLSVGRWVRLPLKV